MPATPGRSASGFAFAVVVALALAFVCAAKSLSQGPVQLSIDQIQGGGALYIEGSIPYVRVARRGGPSVELRLDEKEHAELRIDPGPYRISSWQRPCSGNCGRLDPPTDRCSRAFFARGSGDLHATVFLHPGAGCRIRISTQP